MPFTVSHIAAVLPFSRLLARWRLMSATVIGSMVPDFGFLLPWRISRVETHSAWGLLTFCLPVGLAAFWWFQYLVKPALLAVLPDGAFARWQSSAIPADPASPWQWVLAALGVEVGAASHLVWDAFTHEGARGMRIFPLLDDPVVEIAGHHLIGAHLMQDLSSLVGLLLVATAAVFALRAGRPDPLVRPARPIGQSERLVWSTGYLVAAAVLTGLFLIMHPLPDASGRNLGFAIETTAIAALRGLAAAVILVSLAVMFRLRAARAPRARL